MKQLFQNILAKSGNDQIDFNYFIKFALNDQISWDVLGVFLDDFTSDLSKSKDLNRILLEQLRQFHLILKNNGLFPSSNTKNGSIQNGKEFPDDENAIEEVDFELPYDDNKDEESQNEATHLDSNIKIICNSGNEINNQKNEIRMKKVTMEVDKSFNQKKIYECQCCKKLFEKASALRSHEKTHKKKNEVLNRSFDCEICGKKIESKKSFLAHIESHKMQPSNQYLTSDENDIDKVEFDTPSDDKNDDQYTNDPIHIDPVDEIISDSEDQSKQQNIEMKKIVIQLNKSEKIYGCHFCNKMFVKATSLRNHERIHKKNNQILSKSFNCETCGKKIKSKEKFLDHIEAHKMQTNLEQYLTDRKMFECIKCLNNFEIDLALKHDHKCFECKLCGKLMQVFTLKSHEQRHKKQIENEDENTKPVKCLKCPKRFKSHLGRYLHNKIHDSNRQTYKCKFCSKKLTSLLGLKHHEKESCKTLKN